MPIYLQLSNLIIPKKTLTQKYSGGIQAFINDTGWGKSEFDAEDDELFCLAAMNIDEFELTPLMDAGLILNVDYSILNRYSVPENIPYWLQHNKVFAWHIQCNKEQIALAMNYSELSAEVFFERKLFKPIRSEIIY